MGTVKLRVLCLGGVIHVLGMKRKNCIFRQKRKNIPRIFLNDPNRTKFEDWENTEIPGNSVKLLFSTLHRHFFQNVYLIEILYTYKPDSVLSHIFPFSCENWNFFLFFRIIFSSFFHIFRIFKNLKTLENRLIGTFISNLMMRTNGFYLLRCLRESVSRKSVFLTKTGKT